MISLQACKLRGGCWCPSTEAHIRRGKGGIERRRSVTGGRPLQGPVPSHCRRRGPQNEKPQQSKYVLAGLSDFWTAANKSSTASIACAHLRAKYRWAVTGTPILNRLQGTYGPVPSLELMLIHVEMYAFLRFLKIEPGNGFEDFRRKFKVTTKDNEELTVRTFTQHARMQWELD